MNLKPFKIIILFSLLFSLFACKSHAPITEPGDGVFSVNLKILKPVNRGIIELEVRVKNLSNKELKIIKNRSQNFLWEKTKSLGNYVIHIEKYESGRYDLFSPTADMDLVYQIDEYISFENGGIITDTLIIHGNSFRSAESRNGFPLGNYRIRVYFNLHWSNVSQANKSSWVKFNIEQ